MATKATPGKKRISRKKKRKKSPIRPQIRKSDQVDEKQETANVLASGEALGGKYANVAMIKHTGREFVFEFVLRLDNEALLASRIITSPAHAKELHEALGKNIEVYEKTYGKIQSELKPQKGSKSIH